MSKISLNANLERRIIEASRKDRRKFAPLYNHYQSHVLNFFKYRVSDNHSAEELTSMTFEKILNGLDNYQWQGIPFSAWIFRIARNTLIDHYRKAEKLKKNSQLDKNHLEISDQETPATIFEEESSETVLYKIVNELPSREREIIFMKFFDGYTNRLIADLSGLTETNVGTIIYRALRKMREMYEKDS